MSRNLFGQILIGVFYAAKTPTIILLLSLFGKLFPWNGVNDDFMKFPEYYNITSIKDLQ